MLEKTNKQRITKTLTEIIVMVISVSIIILMAENNRYVVVEDIESVKTEYDTDNNTLTVWYNNENYKQYLICLAEEYKKDKGIELELKYVSAIDYFQSINKADKHMDDSEGNPPDVYMLSSEELEEAYGYGLATENDSTLYSSDNYSDTALRAITYKGKYVAYPLSFNTAFMIYNTAYIQSAPNTIDDILSYEENFSWDDNSNISHVLYFNISDILHTYGFVGEYIDIGGKNGDDDESFTVDTEKLKEALNYYNTLSKSFRITLDDEFQDIPEEFMNGKIICSIIDMSEFSKIRQMINLEGISYNICELPKINSELKMKGLSYTEVMVVNYMSDKVDMAKELAEYATYYRTDLIYPNTGMLPAKYSDYVDSFNETIQKQYSNSVVLPKFRVTKDYYLQMQSLLNAAWKGNNIDEMIQNITETYKKRLQ